MPGQLIHQLPGLNVINVYTPLVVAKNEFFKLIISFKNTYIVLIVFQKPSEEPFHSSIFHVENPNIFSAANN